MKRIAILLVSAALLAACGGKSKPMATTPAAEQSMETEAVPDGASADDDTTDAEEATGGAKSAPADGADPCGGGE